MTHDPEVLTAEAEGIVRELARDPRSTLLRVPRTRGIETLFSAQRRFDPDHTGLIAAERELVRVHREEIARLLRQAATHRLINDPNPKYHITKFISPTQRRAPLNRRLFDAEALALTAPARDIAGHAVFDALLGHDIAHWPSVLELTTLAQRFVATDQGRILAGIALVRDDLPELALKVFRDVAERRGTGSVAANAWANCALAFINTGQRGEAGAAQARASELGESTGGNDVNWLVNSLLLGNVEWASRAAQRIDHCFDELCPMLIEQVSGQHAKVLELELEISRTAESLGRKLADRWKPSARMVLRVFEH